LADATWQKAGREQEMTVDIEAKVKELAGIRLMDVLGKG
jgi:hypothetical protein